MEAKFRPIPISIMDFLGVLVPGFLWATLIAKTYDVLSDPTARLSGLSGVWEPINALAPVDKGWLGPLIVIFAALVAGYSLKPLAMPIADFLCRPAFAFIPSVHKKRVRCGEMSFPFRPYFEKEVYYPKIYSILKSATGIDDVDQLPGSTPFAAAKRFLRAAAPPLWEESERMEAEVRMAGVLFLAATYSLLLHLFLWSNGYRSGWVCAFLSVVAAIALAFGFCILRLREVGYTYLNLLLAEGLKGRLQGQNTASNGKDSNHDDD